MPTRGPFLARLARYGFPALLVATPPGTLASRPGTPSPLPSAAGPLALWIASRPHLGPNTLGSFGTSPARLSSFGRFVAFLVSGDWEAARALAPSLNYDVAAIDDGGARYVAAFDRSGRDATVVVSLAPVRDVVFEAPHVPFEAGTAEEAMELLHRSGGRAALVSGAHRCASMTFAGCSGTTDVCGRSEAYRDSDVGHYAGTLFQVAHQTLAALWPRSVAVSLHGMRDDAEGVRTSLIVSSGAHGADLGMTLPATRLRAWLGRFPSTDGTVVSCNHPPDDRYGYRRLCGFTNVQGRFANGSLDICSASAETATGRFIHLEQDWTVLRPFAEDWRNISRYPFAMSLVQGIIAVTPPAR